MSATSTSDGTSYDREVELKSFDDTKLGVKGLIDSRVTKIPCMFHSAKLDFADTSPSDSNFSIPMIDLQGIHKSSDLLVEVVDQIRSVCKRWGIFQVINHGIPVEVLDEMIGGIRRFHEQDAEVRNQFYSRDHNRKVNYFSNGCSFRDPAANWRDSIAFVASPDPLKPEEIPAVCRLIKMGALSRMKLLHGQEWWRLLSCTFLHHGAIFLLVSLLSLIKTAISFERSYGAVKTAMVYLISGCGGSLLSSMFLENDVSAGGSSPIFGLRGAILAHWLTSWETESEAFDVSALVVDLIYGILPPTDNFSHIGGAVTGFLLGFILLGKGATRWWSKILESLLAAISLVALIFGFVLGTFLLCSGQNGYDYCDWCKYLKGVPTLGVTHLEIQ